MDDDRRRTALHEAAHAVVGHARIAALSGGTDDYATALLALVAALAGNDARGHVRFGAAA